MRAPETVMATVEAAPIVADLVSMAPMQPGSPTGGRPVLRAGGNGVAPPGRRPLGYALCAIRPGGWVAPRELTCFLSGHRSDSVSSPASDR